MYQMNFEDMEFEDVFDGIWACGSLIHIPKNEMPEILGRIHDALCSDGILYISVKKEIQKDSSGERYFAIILLGRKSTAMLEKTGLFEILEVWETDDVRIQPPGYGVGESAGKKMLGAVSEKGGSGC